MDQLEGDRPPAARSAHVALLVIEVVAAIFAAVSVFMLTLNSPGCGESAACLNQIAFTAQAGAALILIVLAVSAIAVALLRRRGRSAVLPPIIGLVLIVMIVVVANVVVESAVPAC